MKAPLGILFVTSCDLTVNDQYRVKADALNAIGSEVESRAILGLIREAGRVKKEAGLGAVIPLGARAGDALLVTLIENNISLSHNLVRRLVICDFVCLQAIGPHTNIDVALINDDALT